MHPGPLAFLGIMLRTRGRMARHALREVLRERWVLALAVLIITLIFVGFEFFFTTRLLSLIQLKEELGPLRTVLMVKLLNMTLLVLLAMLVYSDLVFTISDLFLASDMDLYLAAPVPLGRLFAAKLTGVGLSGAWMFLGFGLPLFWAYGWVVEAPWPYYPLLVPALLPLAAIPAGLGGALALGLVYVFSPQRAQRVLLGAGFVLAVGLVILMRYMRPEQLIDPIGLERMTGYLSTLRIPTSPWLPSTWGAEATQALAEGRWGAALAQFGRLAAGAAGAWLLALGLARFLLGRTLSGERQGSGSGVGAGIHSGSLRRWGSLSRRLDRSIWGKDIRLFLRDPGQWSQLIILGALVAVYTINFKNLPYALYNYQTMMSYVGLGATGLIMAAVAARFAYPALSLESGAYWVVASAPLKPRRLLRQKLVLNLIPTLVLGQLLALFTNVVLEAGLRQTLLSCAVAAAMAVALSCMGVGMGASSPRFSDSAAQVAVSLGGLGFMMASALYVGLVLALITAPEVIRFFPRLHVLHVRLGEWDRWFALGGIGVLTLATAWIPMRRGARKLVAGEWG